MTISLFYVTDGVSPSVAKSEEKKSSASEPSVSSAAISAHIIHPFA